MDSGKRVLPIWHSLGPRRSTSFVVYFIFYTRLLEVDNHSEQTGHKVRPKDRANPYCTANQ